MLYEQRKHDGTLPIIGVNTFRNPDGDQVPATLELARSDDGEKLDQIARLHRFQQRNADTCEPALHALREVALAGGNVFAELMHTVRHASLGQITDTLFEVGGKYRRNV
jgi:methylmalonyl-CoA mutase